MCKFCTFHCLDINKQSADIVIHRFHSFFSHVDNFRVPIFLYLSSKGLEACGEARTESAAKPELSRRQRGGLWGRNRNDETSKKENDGEGDSTAAPATSTEEKLKIVDAGATKAGAANPEEKAKDVEA